MENNYFDPIEIESCPILHVKGRWEEAEEIIMESAHYSNLYARNVIKGKLPEKMHNFMIANGMIEKINRKEKESVRHYFDFLKFSSTNNK